MRFVLRQNPKCHCHAHLSDLRNILLSQLLGVCEKKRVSYKKENKNDVHPLAAFRVCERFAEILDLCICLSPEKLTFY